MKKELIRDIIDSYADSLNYFSFLKELEKYKLRKVYEESEELQQYLEKTWY